MKKARILVLCTANSCRSQMGEGLIRRRFGDAVEVFSAGAQPAERVHPSAVETLRERGVDVSAHKPKSTELFLQDSFDMVITTCNSARDACPVFPGPARRLHWDLADPASAQGTPEEVAAVFRATADSLEERIEGLEPLIAEINESV